jgi:hypothetical protein
MGCALDCAELLLVTAAVLLVSKERAAMTSMEESSAIDALLTVDLPEERYTIARQGKEIELQIRGLTHDEALALQEYSKKDDVTNALYEQRMLTHALLWPKMTGGQIKAWQKSSAAGEINDVVKIVMRLSGMEEDAAKNAYKSVSAEPESGE